jgi:hypothetical protein
LMRRFNEIFNNLCNRKKYNKNQRIDDEALPREPSPKTCFMFIH